LSFRGTLDELEAELCRLAEEFGYGASISNKYYGWYQDPDSPLVQMTVKAYEETGKIHADVKAIHAGLECGLFSEYRKGIQIISIGPTITGCHSKAETLYKDTIGPTIDVILYNLKHISEINGR